MQGQSLFGCNLLVFTEDVSIHTQEFVLKFSMKIVRQHFLTNDFFKGFLWKSRAQFSKPANRVLDQSRHPFRFASLYPLILELGDDVEMEVFQAFRTHERLFRHTPIGDLVIENTWIL